MDKLNVLQIGKYYHPYKGGLEESMYLLVNELKDKVRMRVLASHTCCHSRVEKQGKTLVVRLASFGKLFSQPLTPALFFCMKRFRSDIVHLHLPNPLAMICYYVIRPSGKLIVSYHGETMRQKTVMFLLRPVLKYVFAKAQAIVVTSANLAAFSPDLEGFRDKCQVIPHGIDVDRFAPVSRQEIEKIKGGVKTPIILFVGRLVYYKGLEYLIRAMKDIEAALIIVGTGPLKERLESLAVDEGVVEKIRWAGEVSDRELPGYYQACDCFVLPSCVSSESFGIVVLEAHASKKPVVSTRLPTGVTFTNLSGVTGESVPAKDACALARAINKLLSSESLRRKYGENGYARVCREFRKEEMGKRFLTLYGAISNSLPEPQ